jgi:hypothetical protein
MALPFALKSILLQKKNYGNSNISPCKNIIFQKHSKRNQNPSRYYNLISSKKVETNRVALHIFLKTFNFTPTFIYLFFNILNIL